MEDKELQALQERKLQLIKQASNLIEKLKEQEERGFRRSFPEHLLSPAIEVNFTVAEEEALSEKREIKHGKVIREVTGIRFKDVDKKWLKDTIYSYTCKLVSKALSFYLDMSVDAKGKQDFEILDINCHFVDIQPYLLLEIETWVQCITRKRNFSLLVTAISQYSDNSIHRSKILRKVEAQGYGTVEQCEERNGGILIHVHSTKDKEKIYLMFQWSILFLDRTCHMENYFTINPTNEGIEFAETYQNLLKKFCKYNVTKSELTELWQKLGTALAQYEEKQECGIKDTE